MEGGMGMAGIWTLAQSSITTTVYSPQRPALTTAAVGKKTRPQSAGSSPELRYWPTKKSPNPTKSRIV